MLIEFLKYKILPSVLFWTSIAFALVVIPLLHTSIYTEATLPKTPLPISVFKDLRIVGAMIVGMLFLSLAFKFISRLVPSNKRSGDLDRILCKIHDEATSILVTLGTITIVSFVFDERFGSKTLPSMNSVIETLLWTLGLWLLAFVWFLYTQPDCKKITST